jgi:hypothetical protein
VEFQQYSLAIKIKQGKRTNELQAIAKLESKGLIRTRTAINTFGVRMFKQAATGAAIPGQLIDVLPSG